MINENLLFTMFHRNILIKKSNFSLEKNNCQVDNSNNAKNLNCILQNYSGKKSFKFNIESQKNLKLFNLNNGFDFFKLINEKLVIMTKSDANFNKGWNSKGSFSEKFKQNFKNFFYFSVYYKNQLFVSFLEYILHKFSLHSNSQRQVTNHFKILTKPLNTSLSREKISARSRHQEKILLSQFKEEAFFSTFVQSLVSQIYFKKSLKEKNFGKKILSNLNNEKTHISMEFSLNFYYFEIWKQASCCNFSNVLNKTSLFELELSSDNFNFEILLNLWSIYKNFLFSTQFQDSSVNEVNLMFTAPHSTKPFLIKMSKTNIFNFYSLKQIYYEFSYFYFLVFSLKKCPLRFENFSLQTYFKDFLSRKFKNKWMFPNFFQNLKIEYLTLKNSFLGLTLYLKTDLIIEKNFKNKNLFFLNFIYLNVLTLQEFFKIFKVFYFSKKFYTAYITFKSFSANNLNTEVKNFFINQTYLGIEKLHLELLQKISLKNERNVEISQVYNNILFSFSSINKENYFVLSCVNKYNLEKYFLFLNLFNIWVEKNYSLDLKTLNSGCFNIILIYNLNSSFIFKNSLFFPIKQVPNSFFVKEILLTKNLNQKILNFNCLNFSLTEIKKLMYMKKVKQIVKIYSSQTQEKLISKLSPYILSWFYLFRFQLKKNDWNELDKILSQVIWRWACRRHNNKSKKWIQSKYFFTLNQDFWFFGQFLTHSGMEVEKLNKNGNFIYLPFHRQIYDFVYLSEK